MNDDLVRVQISHDDTIVMFMTIVNYDIERVLVGNGSFTDVLFYDTFSQMKLPKQRSTKKSYDFHSWIFQKLS